MPIGRPVGRTKAQLAKAAATKRRAREFEKATSSEVASLGWKMPVRGSSGEYCSETGMEALPCTSTQNGIDGHTKEDSQ